MQCTGYIPLYYLPRNVNGASDFSWHLLNGSANYGEERGLNSSLPTWIRDRHLGYNKEVLRQVIQNQEATFRCQVQELHQLYERQKELMDEMRMRDIFGQHLQPQTSKSINCLSEISQISHKSSWLFGNHSHNKLHELTGENIHQSPNPVADNFPEYMTVRPVPLTGKNSHNEVKVLSSVCEGNGKRMLDLELPADAYHDREGKWFKENNQCEAAEVMQKALNMLFYIQPTSDSEISSVKTGDLPNSKSSNRKRNCLIDLNEPMQFESLSSTSSCPSGTYTSHMKIMCHDLCLSVDAIPESAVPKHSGLLNCDSSSDDMNSSVGIDLNSMPTNVSETETTLENLWTLSKETTEDLDNGSAEDQAVRKRKCIGENSFTDTGLDDKSLKMKTCIDLNNVAVVGELSPSVSPAIKTAVDTVLEGLASPENEECSPPIGKSEYIQLKTHLLSEKGLGEPPLELDVVAAQTLTMIFSSGIRECKKATIPKPIGGFRNCLYWFAEIASSNGDDLENEDKKLLMRVSEETTANPSHAVEKEKETGTLSGSSAKGHTRRKRLQKDHGIEVLPSLASVSKDFHSIKEFLEKGLQKRNTGRKARASAQKISKSVPLGTVKKSMNTILKQPATHSKQGVLQGWGKTRRRRGGRKHGAGKFLVIS